ncbi:transposase B domain protein [Staphylococcus aureus subsp. aureus CIG1233]|nr:transposase B domain protein [Staphylococcus aureus subsp. aureus CIG1233]
MNEEMQGFWANNSWDIRKCPHPSAIELSKNPALRNRWVRFERVKNLWLRTELKYFILPFKQWNMECKNCLD